MSRNLPGLLKDFAYPYSRADGAQPMMLRLPTSIGGLRRSVRFARVLAALACLGLAVAGSGEAWAQADASRAQLPEPTTDPLRIDFASDPILRLSEQTAPVEEFRQAVASAVARHPARLEAVAADDEARAALSEARERLFPSGDLTITSYKVLSREFSNDPANIIERSRPDQRTDVLMSVQQTVFDFGATSQRIAAARLRLAATAADVEYASDRLALNTIANWYDLFAYRALVAVALQFTGMQEEFRAAIRERVGQGVSAETDIARVESYIAAASSRLAQLQRAAAQAEARYVELSGMAPLSPLPRAPHLGTVLLTKEEAELAAQSRANVRSAEAVAAAAHQDFRATRSESLPQVTAGIDAGRYGLFETERDYDVRARVTLRHRFLGGVEPRIEQSGARSRAAAARALRVREEAERDAAIAWSDVRALENQLDAVRQAYIASRLSRDALFERFRVSSGTLTDALAANDAYFDAAIAYVQAMSELDAARYVLLSTTGGLLQALDIEPPPGTGGRQ